MRLAIIADTHMPKGTRALPEACLRRLRAADLILHAGDFVGAAVLRDLQALGPPVHAVFGNVDDLELRSTLPERREIKLATGLVLGMVHDAGPRSGRLARLRHQFPGCEAVVYGHSHMPLHETDSRDGFQMLNPGSPTERRRSAIHTMAEGVVVDGRLELSIVDVDEPVSACGHRER